VTWHIPPLIYPVSPLSFQQAPDIWYICCVTAMQAPACLQLFLHVILRNTIARCSLDDNCPLYNNISLFACHCAVLLRIQR
jgi:hypothetical protein